MLQQWLLEKTHIALYIAHAMNASTERCAKLITECARGRELLWVRRCTRGSGKGETGWPSRLAAEGRRMPPWSLLAKPTTRRYLPFQDGSTALAAARAVPQEEGQPLGELLAGSGNGVGTAPAAGNPADGPRPAGEVCIAVRISFGSFLVLAIARGLRKRGPCLRFSCSLEYVFTCLFLLSLLDSLERPTKKNGHLSVTEVASSRFNSGRLICAFFVDLTSPTVSLSRKADKHHHFAMPSLYLFNYILPKDHLVKLGM